jgi:hypothetical protein
MNNIDKYLCNVTLTADGVVYKNHKPFAEIGDDEILYMSEHDISSLLDFETLGYDLTDKELADLGFAETKRTITDSLLFEYPSLDEETIKGQRLVELVLDCCTWQSASTAIASLAEDEYYGDLLGNEAV